LVPRRREADGHPRLAVDRAFTLPGAGLIVTGTLVAGRIAPEDRLMLSPAGLEVRVRGLHAQNRPATRAEAGQRVALNIAGPRLSKDMVNRGDWVVHPDLHAPVDRLDARIHLVAGEKRPVRQDTPVHLHLGAAHVMARAFPLDVGRLEAGGSALVRLVLDRPIGALTMDRMVLRDAGATRTIGGGVVVDPFPPRRGGRTPARMAQLAACEAPEAADALRGVLALPPHWTNQTVFFRSRNMPTAAQPGVLDAAGAIAIGGLAMTQAASDRLRGLVINALADRHRTAPDQPGWQAERLRALITERPPRHAFGAVIDTLLHAGAVAQDGPWLRLPGHAISLTAQDQRLWDAAHALLTADRFRPPRARDLAQALHVPETAMRGLLKRLQRMGRLVEVAPDRFFLREALAAMLAIAADAEATEQGLTAAVFRDRLTIGRNVAIQILEFFDRSGVTIRSGDTRRVRRDRAAFFGPPPDAPPHAG
jgi:selenocysteine-specific elongation factor